MVFDGLTSTFDGLHMIQQASAVSRDLQISREDQDAWAARSHERAAAAQDAGRFDDEIVPVGDVTSDESVRRDTTIEKLATLKPVFDPDGTTTAGNAPGVTDGGSCVVVCSEEWAEKRGIEPLARILGTRTSPRSSPTSRARPRPRPRRRSPAGRTMDDVARIEINEAFASVAKQSTRCSAPTRSWSTSTAAPSRSVTRSAPRWPHRRDARARAATKRRRPRPRRDLLRRPARATPCFSRSESAAPILAAVLAALGARPPAALALECPNTPLEERRAGRRRIRGARHRRACRHDGDRAVYRFVVDQRVKGQLGGRSRSAPRSGWSRRADRRDEALGVLANLEERSS